jgi:hypothetical protein
VIDGIISGLRAAGGAVAGVIQGIAQSAIDAAKAALGIQSPSTVFFDIGVNLVEGLIWGIEALAERAYAAAMKAAEDITDPIERQLAELAAFTQRHLDIVAGHFEALGKLSGFGGAFGDIFKARTLDPTKAKLDEMTETIDGIVERLGLGGMSIQDQIWNAQGIMKNRFATRAQRAEAGVLIQMLRERRDLNQEYIKQQERLLQLQEKQAQVNFLQQQFQLLEMIRTHGLDEKILEGLQFGIHADPAKLMDAMTAAIQAMIKAAEDQLGIHSPSRWAVNLGKNVMGTLGKTLKGDTPSLQRDVSMAIGGGFNGGVRDVGGSRSTVINIDARGAQRGVDRDLRRMVLDVMREAGVKGDIRLRTS